VGEANYRQGDVIESSSAVPMRTETGELDGLMTRYQQAEAAGTTALIAAVSPALYRYFLRYCRDRDTAADLLQETWLRIHRVRHTYRAGEPVLPWLYAVARRVRVDGYRRKRRIESRERAVDSLPEAHAACAPAERSLPDFDRLLAELPEGQREVVTMLKVSGMSLEEVARATRSSVGSVKQKAHRAYEKLRQLLDTRDIRESSAK
jgi:RNA polymerase sigma-70 factor (ECF subfamily)